MNSTFGQHDEQHLERVLLYSLRTLPATERAAVAQQLAECPRCRGELQSLRPLIDSLGAWPADVLHAPESLWGRLVERIGGTADSEPAPLAPPPEWKDVAPGISCQLLSTDAASQRVSMLVRLAPGTEYPPHRHAGVEELHLLDGELVVNDKTLSPGDYLRSEPGSEDHRVWSATGCTCFLLTSVDDAILKSAETEPEGHA